MIEYLFVFFLKKKTLLMSIEMSKNVNSSTTVCVTGSFFSSQKFESTIVNGLCSWW
jgi:hypothetical protein